MKMMKRGKINFEDNNENASTFVDGICEHATYTNNPTTTTSVPTTSRASADAHQKTSIPKNLEISCIVCPAEGDLTKVEGTSSLQNPERANHPIHNNYINLNGKNQINSTASKNDAMGKDKEMENDDGANEKMLKAQEASIAPAKNTTEVLLISENGDAKIEMENGKPALCGMDKEELMKYANDPFWVKLRWALFIGFWIIWFAMLAGAIAIIVTAPKCSQVQPRALWQKSPIVKFKRSTIQNKNITDIRAILDEVKKHHVEYISLEPIFSGSVSDGYITNFTSVDSQIGSIDYIKEIIKEANERNQKIVLEIEPNHISTKSSWFEKSIKKVDNFTSYFVWRKGNGDSPPTNWKSVDSTEPAWTINSERNEYYLHQFSKNEADFNFTNPDVLNEFKKIFEFWLNLGFDGFRIGKSQFLIEKSYEDENSVGQSGVGNDYSSQMHSLTKDCEENIEILLEWRNITLKHVKDGLFSLRDDTSIPNFGIVTGAKKVIDLPQHSNNLITATSNAELLKNTIVELKNNSAADTWLGWELNTDDSKSNISTVHSEDIALMLLLLPGTPILQLNHVLNKTRFAAVSKLREEKCILHGEFVPFSVGTVFGYTRLYKGSPGYVVLYQTAENDTEVDISKIEHVPEEIQAVLNTVPEDFQRTMDSKKVPVKGKSTMIMSFVPKDLE